MVIDIFAASLNETWISFFVAVLAFLIYDFWCHTYWWRQGVPSVPAWPIMSNMVQLSAGVAPFQMVNQNKYGTVYGMYHYRQPGLVCGDPELAKKILINSFSKFQNRKWFALNNQELDESVTNLHDDRWRDMRGALVTAFSAARLNQISHRAAMHTDRLVENMETKMKQNDYINCGSLFGDYIMDLLGSCILDVDMGAQVYPDSSKIKSGQKAMSLTKLDLNPDFSYVVHPGVILSGIFPWLNKVIKSFKIGMFSRHTVRFFRNITRKVASKKARSRPGQNGNKHSKSDDILQFMMDICRTNTSDDVDGGHDVRYESENQPRTEKESRTKIEMTDAELIGQTSTFFLAGYDATRTTMIFTALLLARNQDKQDKLLQEIDEMVPPDQNLDFHFVSKLPYLHQVLCETLRMYPPAARTSRMCNETLTYRDVTIPRGMQVLIPIIAMHYNPDYWPEPEKFIPERFSKEEQTKTHAYAWLPFGLGPRMCFGYRFALMMVKMALVRVLKGYRFETSPLTKDSHELGKTSFIISQNDVIVRIIPRHAE